MEGLLREACRYIEQMLAVKHECCSYQLEDECFFERPTTEAEEASAARHQVDAATAKRPGKCKQESLPFGRAPPSPAPGFQQVAGPPTKKEARILGSRRKD